MATMTKFHSFVEAMAEKKHDLGADTLKVMLTNSAPNASSHTQKSDITEIASTSNGYTAGGSQATQSSSAQTSGTYKLVVGDVTFTQSGANDIGPFRYVVLYNDTSTNDLLIGFYDFGSNVTLVGSSGNIFTTDFDATNGVLQLT